MTTEWQHRRNIVEICKRIYERGYIAGADGNVSVRVSNNKILVTPSKKNKGYLVPEDMVLCDNSGDVFGNQRLKPTSELPMHLEIYSTRPDVQAIVHAHPPTVVAFSIVDLDLSDPLVPEAIMTLGGIKTAPYSTPGTDDIPNSIRRLLLEANSIVLTRHGAVTVGESVFQAFDRIDCLEHIAQIAYHAHQLGRVTPLPVDEIKRLEKLVGLPYN